MTLVGLNSISAQVGLHLIVHLETGKDRIRTGVRHSQEVEPAKVPAEDSPHLVAVPDDFILRIWTESGYI